MNPASALILSLLLTQAPAPLDAYRKATDAWHAERLAELRQEDGWLSLIGRDWLQPGENSLGSAPGSAVLLPGWAGPAQAGAFIVEGQTVRFRPFPGSGLLLNGKPATETVLKTEEDRTPDILSAERVRLTLLHRQGRFAVRLRDPEAPTRKAFRGVDRYPVDPTWRAVADFSAYPAPQPRQITTVLGTTTTMSAPGLLRFRLGGREFTLEPMLLDPEHPELFIVFKDGTSGHGTYPAGRFLYAEMPKDGKVVLDFNRAINPPCAFTTFATCPLPPRQNQLDLAIPAGEKDPGPH